MNILAPGVAPLCEARRLLAESALNLEEVADTLGLSSAPNFAIASLENSRCTPTGPQWQ